MLNKYIFPISAMLLLSLNGCTQKQVIPVANDDTPLIKQISTSAGEIHRELLQLNKLKEMNPHVYQAKATPSDGPLTRKITLKWVGHPEEAVKTISTLVAFSTPKIIGNPPPNMKSVSINAVEKPAFEVLEDIGMQMGDSAGISIGDSQIAVIYQ